jgi:two-component system, response regulator PdtaR
MSGFWLRRCRAAHNGHEAIQIFEKLKPEYLLLDVRLGPGPDGVEIAKLVHATQPDSKIIFVTGSNEPAMIAHIKTDHPWKILIKPIKSDDLGEALNAPRHPELI